MKPFSEMTGPEQREFWADVGKRVAAMLPPAPEGMRSGYVLIAVGLGEGRNPNYRTVQVTDLLPDQATRAMRQVLARVSKVNANDYELPPVRKCVGCKVPTSGTYPDDAAAGGVPTCGKLECMAAARKTWEETVP